MLFEIVQDIIEIREDAYKQNEVYRPWPAEVQPESTDKGTPSPARRPRANSLAGSTKPH
jgi:hypothetical protein